MASPEQSSDQSIVGQRTNVRESIPPEPCTAPASDAWAGARQNGWAILSEVARRVGRLRFRRRPSGVECKLTKRGSAKQIAEESPRRVATRRNIFLKAKGCMLTKTILVMVFTSTGRANSFDELDAVERFAASLTSNAIAPKRPHQHLR